MGSLARSPGATTWALACASAGSARRMLLVEADADGGVLAARLGLSLHAQAPTLVSWLASVRNGPDASTEVDDHVQGAPCGARVVCGPPLAELAAAAAARLVTGLDLLPVASRDVVVDVGRLRPESSAWRIAAGCDVRMVVARPVLEELEPLLAGFDHLAALGLFVVVLRGRGAYTVEEISTAFAGQAVVWASPEDPTGVAVLAGQRRGVAAKTAIVRSAGALLNSLGGVEVFTP